MFSIVLFSFCVLTLWLSHRLHDTYVRIVAKEEFRELRANRKQRGRPGDAPTPRHHLGPKLFLLIDALSILAIIWSLKHLGFFFTEERLSRGAALALTCVHFSIVVAFWLLLETAHLKRFYSKLAHALRRPDSDSDRVTGPPRWLVSFLLLWTALPIALELMGVHVISHARTAESAYVLFALAFLAPQLIFLSMFARSILPLRRLVYDRNR
ncbi:MAG TPA: hypothetical protein ENK43_16405 [Planctomycetes bacterium]|nr:hypothetical protein [Planctomycetota bacterium]